MNDQVKASFACSRLTPRRDTELRGKADESAIISGMPSPFPGMDPYLERHWRDVHGDLVGLSRSALNSVLPPDLVARMEERIVVDSVQYDKPRAIYPDVRVYEDFRHGSPAGSTAADASAVAQPIVLEFESEEHTETYVTILDANGGELVSV